MRRVTIRLPEELLAALDREARRRRVSVSQLVREALQARFGLTSRPRDLPFVAAGRSGHRSTARDVEDVLRAELDRDRVESARHT
jgi:Arc/MetJ-type ribon-helix-helix transcriptional regulator